MSKRILAASANVGIGLWTSICVSFCRIFGKESKAYRGRQKRVLDAANRRLLSQLEELGEGYVLSDYRVTWSGGLAVTVSALACLGGDDGEDKPKLELAKKAKEAPKQKLCPRCGAPVEDDMLFCGECGAKLK